MSRGIFITATGTDIGKTYVTALIIKKLRTAGFKTGYYKAALSGAEVTAQGLLAGDAHYVNEVAQIGEDESKMVSYVYEHAVSPHLAARLSGNPVELSVIQNDYKSISSGYEYMVAEGSGGIVCPIRCDEKQKLLLEDIIQALRLETLLIADAGLGTINATVLTAEYMKNRKIPIRGIILNHFHKGDVMEEDNKYMIEMLTGIPVIATVQEQATELDMETGRLIQCFKLY